MKKVLAFVREQRAALGDVGDEDLYRKGYDTALAEVEEHVLDLMWERGEDDDEA